MSWWEIQPSEDDVVRQVLAATPTWEKWLFLFCIAALAAYVIFA